MTVVTPRRLAAVAAVPALALGLAACSSDSTAESNEDGSSQLSPEQVVLSSYEDLASQSYQMEMTVTVNGVTFLEATNQVEGEASRSSQDLYLSALMEASGEDLSADPEMAEMMESMFTDVHTETILVDGVVYIQLSGGMMDTSEEFGEDAWFTTDLADSAVLDQVYQQVGGFDLASQTETLLNQLTDVQETGDGVYTGTLNADSEIAQAMLGVTTASDPTSQQMLDGIEVTITVDDAGLLKQMEMTFPEVEGMTMHMVSEVVEVGGSYDITAPDSDNLYSIEELTGAMQ